MQLTPEAQRILADLARRYGISPEAAQAVFRSLAANDGRMAQFDHPDLGGMGQWLRGGMTMVGDMFNGRVKQQVDALCADIADALQRMGSGAAAAGSAPRSQGQSQSRSQGAAGWWDTFAAGRGAGDDGTWWPADLGTPSSSGAKDDLRYAVFPAVRRLAIRRGGSGGRVELYDTGDRRVFGVSQGGGDPVFSTDEGAIRLADLARVGAGGAAQDRAEPWRTSGEERRASPVPAPHAAAGAPMSTPPAGPDGAASGDPLLLIERLAELRQRGVLTEQEFTAKKTELLGRL